MTAKLSPELQQQFALGYQYHQMGKIQEAEAIYRHILTHQPNHAETLHLMGALACQVRQFEPAIELMSRAIASDPGKPYFYNNLANIFRDLGQPSRALELYQKALEINPDYIEAHNNIANALIDLQDFPGAIHHYEVVLNAFPEKAEIHTNIGFAYKESKNHEKAIHHFNKALEIKPEFANAYNYLGLSYIELNQRDKGIQYLKKALELNPNFLEVNHNLGNQYQAKNQWKKAIDYYQRALELYPENIETLCQLAKSYLYSQQIKLAQKTIEQAHTLSNTHFSPPHIQGLIFQEQGQLTSALAQFNQALKLNDEQAEIFVDKGLILHKLGDFQASLKSYQQALAIQPDLPKAHLHLGNLYQELNQTENALKQYQLAIQAHSDFGAALTNAGICYQLLGDIWKAIESYEGAFKSTQQDAALIRSAVILPAVYKNDEELHWWRSRYIEKLEDIRDITLEIKDPIAEMSITNFYLSYQGKNDIQQQKQFAQLCLKACPDLNYQINAHHSHQFDKPIKIGFISENLKQHSIGKFLGGTIVNLSKDKFERYIFRFNEEQDKLASWMNENVEHHEVLPRNLAAARTRLEELQLDIIFYPDLGMSPITFFLAFARLAPIQCVTWGHGVTTGIPNIDYYISCQDMESEDPQQYYSETLLLMKNLISYYLPYPTPKEPFNFQSLNLPEASNTYLCAHSIFKMLPEFDPIINRILQEDPQGFIILLSGEHPVWQQILEKRLEDHCGENFHRIKFIPYQSPQEFLKLANSVDVILDPIPIVGGNTTYDTMLLGTPIVTLPTQISRGRVTYACYKKMRVLDCVATSKESYVKLAVKLATNKIYQAEISRKMIANAHRLYEDITAVNELEDLLVSLIEKSVNLE